VYQDEENIGDLTCGTHDLFRAKVHFLYQDADSIEERAGAAPKEMNSPQELAPHQTGQFNAQTV
jgi:hypothetical protein